MLVGAGEDGHAAVLFDAHGHFRADQVETFGADMTAQQAQARDAHLGLRRTRHHRAVGVAHHDVADAHRSTAALSMLDLGAADFDMVAAAEIFLDGRRQARGHNVELNGSAGEPPPQAARAQAHQRDECGDGDCAAADEPLVLRKKAQVNGAVGMDRRHWSVDRGQRR